MGLIQNEVFPVMLRLKHHQIIPENSLLKNMVVLGLISNPSATKCHLDFCFLKARYYIWLSRRKEYASVLRGFIKL